MNNENNSYLKMSYIFKLLLRIECIFLYGFNGLRKTDNLKKFNELILSVKSENISDSNQSNEKYYVNNLEIINSRVGLVETLLKEAIIIKVKRKRNNIEETVFSMVLKPARTYYRTREIIVYACQELFRRRAYFTSVIESNEIVVSNKYTNSTLILLKIVFRNIYKSLNRKQQNIKSNWDIYFNEISNRDIGQLEVDLKIIKHDSTRFWADPFLFEYNNEIYLFIEEYFYNKKKGEIAVLKRNADRIFEYLGVALSFPYHLSFPCIFRRGADIFMIPESGSQMRVDLFRCIDFPMKWEFSKTLLSGKKFSDPVLFRKDGTDFLFVSLDNGMLSSESQLYLYYSSDILTDILESHPLNPIQLGLEKSRMAGNIYEKDGVLYRPAQDCSIRYGGSIRFMRILEITKERYFEIESYSLLHFEGKLGTHTYNQLDNLYVVDAY